jgi:hypothetical protein
MTRRWFCLVLLFAGIALVATSAPAGAQQRHVDLSIVSIAPGALKNVVGNPVRGAFLDVSIDNYGENAVPAVVVVALPSGWTAACPSHPGAGRTCATIKHTLVWHVRAGQRIEDGFLELNVIPSAKTAFGSITPVRIGVEPVGAVDTNPANNDVIATVVDAGVADLNATVTTDATDVAPGGTVRITVRIVNRGPDRATGTGLFLHEIGGSADGFRFAAPKGVGACEQGNRSTLDPGLNYRCGHLPDIAVGSALNIRLTWHAGSRPQTNMLLVRYGSDGADPTSIGGFDGFLVSEARSGPITIARPAAPSSELASTGTSTFQLTALGLGAIAAGLVLLSGGRAATRPAGRARRHRS